MASTLWYCSLLLTLGQCVLGQQPHDLCYEDFRYAPDHIYPDDWHVIVDSYDYQDLFEDSISVWELRDVDGDGRGWSDTFGGTCQKEIGVGSCSSANPDNWFFTGFNSYVNAIEVIVNVTFRWTRCSPGSCAKVAVYRYDTDNPVSESQQRDPNNYTPVTGNVMTSRLQQNQPTNVDTNVVLRFTRPSSFNGLYLGFRDTGACRGQIKRFQVYYRIAPKVMDGLLCCPEVPLVRGSSSSSTCICVENSYATGSLERECSDSTECSVLPECQCNGGYNISSNGKACVGCDAGTYRALSQSQTSCSDCPENTDKTQIAATQCECNDGFFRAEDEGPSDGCSQPPTAVLNLRAPEMTQTSITLRWEKPSTTSRHDFYYEVQRSDENTVSVYTLITTIQGGTRSTVEYEDTGLTPATTYVYRVIVHNGVSDQDSLNVHLRTREVTKTTSDGVPSKPTRVRGFCSVVVWGEPSEPNGKIVGYDINFYDSNNPSRNKIVFGVTNTVYDVTGSSGVPGVDTEALYFQVRANTSQSNGGGAGLWSDGIPLGCTDECVPPSPPECPSEHELMHFSLGGVDYPNNSIFYISDIGMDDSALLCVTNKTACCGSPNRFGEWLFPNGSMVPSSGSNRDFFRGRGDRIVRLSRRNDAMSPTGVYRCRVPDASGVTQTIQTTIISLNSPAPPTPPTCPPTPPPSSCPPTVTCPAPPETPEPPTCPPPAPVEIHFTFGGVKYPNNSIFDLRDIGQGDSSLFCVTNKTGCCSSPDRFGDWFFPSGSMVRATGNIFSSRGSQFVQLSRRNNALSPTGQYLCRVPDASGVIQTIQATITAPETCPPPTTCPTLSPTTCPPPVDCPPTTSSELHFSLGGVDYPNNSIFYISDIGVDDSALLCVTNRTACCGSPNRFGEWLFPNGSMVPSSGSNRDFFRGRGDRIVRLSRRNDAMSPTGVYRCRVPDASGVTQTLQTTIISLNSPAPPTPPTCPPTPPPSSCPPTVTCPAPPETPEPPTCPPPAPVEIHFTFGGVKYPNNSIFDLRDIGQGDSSLFCVTNKTGCCSSPNRFGDWFFPSGNMVRATGNIISSRGSQFVRLSRRNNALFPTGQYQCRVPDASGVIQTIQATITVPAPCPLPTTCSTLSPTTCPSPVDCPPTTPPELHFSLGGVDYPNNSIFYISDIGVDDSALLCVTNRTACCGSPNRFGEWLFPNGSMVPSSGSNWDFFRGRGDRIVRLSRRNDAMSPTGVYRCRVPDASGDTQTIQATMIGPDGPICTTPDTCTPCETCPPEICLEGVHFRLKGYSYPNNSIFSLKEIGQFENALMCVTNYTNCCNGEDQSMGEWFYPNGSSLNSRNSGDVFFRDRGVHFVRLNRRGSIASPDISSTGEYRCQIPDANGRIQDIYAIIFDLETTTDVQAELITVSTIINDLVILTSAEEFKDIIVRVTVKFTLTDKPEISETITEDFVNPWVRVPSAILQIQQDSPVSVQVRPEFKNESSGMFSLPATFTASESKALFEAVTSGECEPCDTMAFDIKDMLIAVIVSVVGTILIVCLIVCLVVLIIVVIIKCKKRKKSSLPSTYGTRAKDMELYNPTYQAT